MWHKILIKIYVSIFMLTVELDLEKNLIFS